MHECQEARMRGPCDLLGVQAQSTVSGIASSTQGLLSVPCLADELRFLLASENGDSSVLKVEEGLEEVEDEEDGGNRDGEDAKANRGGDAGDDRGEAGAAGVRKQA
eukprot:1156318-Pelagomonas_calceolata.AAC.1